MNKQLPDKWVRKAIVLAVDGITVDTKTIECFDSFTGASSPLNYVLVTTQNNEVEKATKCQYQWRSSVLLEVVTRSTAVGNTGSRVLADNILDAVRNLTDTLALDVIAGMEIVNRRQSFPNDIIQRGDGEVTVRKFLRIELLIN